MRKVQRSMPAPASLAKASIPKYSRKGTLPTTELQRAQAHFKKRLPRSGRRPPFEFKVYKNEDVKQRLEADFHYKCAYCESAYAVTSGLDVEHYRPKGKVVEDPTHEGYWWLAMDWENLLPACIQCNRPNGNILPTQPTTAGGKLKLDAAKGAFTFQAPLTTGKWDSFPITGTRIKTQTASYSAEGALLLDPCEDEPGKFLDFYIDPHAPFGVILPKANTGPTTLAHLTPVEESADAATVAAHAVAVNASVRGAVSIRTYGLNRLQLVRERTRVLRRLQLLEQLLVRAGKVIHDLENPAPEGSCVARHKQAVASLRSMQGMLLTEIRDMAKESSPYTATVKAWVKDFRVRLGSTY